MKNWIRLLIVILLPLSAFGKSQGTKTGRDSLGERRIATPVIEGSIPSPVSGLAKTALRDVGVREGSSRANELARAGGLRSSRQAWCAASVCAWLKSRGHEIPRTGSVKELRRSLLRVGDVSPRPAPGDIAFYPWSHTGIVVAVDLSKGIMIVVEANHNNRVAKVTRRIKEASKFVRV